jgi:hypothetical protein
MLSEEENLRNVIDFHALRRTVGEGNGLVAGESILRGVLGGIESSVNMSLWGPVNRTVWNITKSITDRGVYSYTKLGLATSGIKESALRSLL